MIKQFFNTPIHTILEDDLTRHYILGGNLHLHGASIVPLDWLIKTVTYLPDLYTKEPGGDVPREFMFSKTPLTATDGWQNVAKLRADMQCCLSPSSESYVSTNFTGNQSLDKMFMSELSLFTPDPYNTYKSANDIWSKFNNYFATFRGLRNTLKVAEMCMRKALEDFYADGIQYAEIREGNFLDLNGKDITDEYLRLVRRVVKEFQLTHPDFLGVKFILVAPRFVSEEAMHHQLSRVSKLMKQFPDLVKGFDIVAHEDVGHRIDYYLKQLIRDGESPMPFMFHAGETSWTQGADMNLVDAVLLNATRIGHGFALLKHPKVMEAIREQGVVIEVQPVSNQVLGFVNDLRNHPGATFIANNDRITISSDNFPLWGALPLSHDFYMAFMGLGSTKDDLRLLKQLAINSIKFSTMTDEEKVDAIEKWQQRWTAFIDDVITKYHLV
ncbi:adenosine deaminase CECR1 [Elysia marginata]|uniref:adenosine deaminase n=1 Tax=Elysia marginata TaxID=1093978 RepID=A0AAV4F997_9GAST|nr:adenosine deaminase CECR1 [Elysia marginata]